MALCVVVCLFVGWLVGWLWWWWLFWWLWLLLLNGLYYSKRIILIKELTLAIFCFRSFS